jgi:general secretion pathway protein G
MTASAREARDPGSIFPWLSSVLLISLLLILVGSWFSLAWHQKKLVEAIAKARADLLSLRISLTVYKADNGAMPTTAQGLDALIRIPTLPPPPKNWRGPCWSTYSLPCDPWGNPYVYRNPGVRLADGFDLYSLGPDGQPGTADDIEYD